MELSSTNETILENEKRFYFILSMRFSIGKKSFSCKLCYFRNCIAEMLNPIHVYNMLDS